MWCIAIKIKVKIKNCESKLESDRSGNAQRSYNNLYLLRLRLHSIAIRSLSLLSPARITASDFLFFIYIQFLSHSLAVKF